MKLVLDTNIWVSAFLSKFGEATRLLSILKEKNISIVTSDYILVELERILLSSKIHKILKWEAHETHKYIVAIRDITEYILVSKPDNEILIRDCNDILILQTLIDSNADYLVTGDKDLLVLSDRYPIVRISHIIEIIDKIQ